MDTNHKMSAFECYKEYLALKNHFTRPSYDYFKYNGKSTASVKSFETRSDKLFFAKVAKHPDCQNFLLANLLVNDKAWIRDIAYSEEAQRTYTEWQKRQQSLTYNFQQEIKHLDLEFDSNFKCDGHPKALKLYLQKQLSLETLTILCDLTGCIKYWNRSMEYDPVWSEVGTKIDKYRPFLKYDKEKLKKILLDYFSE
jgi:T4 gene Gp59 loader of gp41 DNA helicase